MFIKANQTQLKFKFLFMSEKSEIIVSRPFGPTIAKVTMSKDLVDSLNKYVDKIVEDEKRSKDQDHGDKLAGNVTQEFHLDQEFLKNSGFAKFLGMSTAHWIKHSGLQNIKKFQILSSWVVRQFKNEYNPTHWHSGHISGVGYIKVPSTFGKSVQDVKTVNPNGNLELIHGTRMFLSNSTFRITPEVGDFYFFPNYMMHTVYPFSNTDQERRSVSFNAKIDDDIYDVYAQRD